MAAERACTLQVTIRIAERLGAGWAGWFEGLEIRPGAPEGTTLCGRLPDQAALFGALNKLHALNLTLMSVSVQIAPEER